MGESMAVFYFSLVCWLIDSSLVVLHYLFSCEIPSLLCPCGWNNLLLHRVSLKNFLQCWLFCHELPQFVLETPISPSVLRESLASWNELGWQLLFSALNLQEPCFPGFGVGDRADVIPVLPPLCMVLSFSFIAFSMISQLCIFDILL